MTREALKLALEALEESKTNNDSMEFHDRKNKAIAAIKEALAQPDPLADAGKPIEHIDVLKLALDLAIMHHSDDGYAELRSKVRQLAKEALAQPEQEPVAWMNNKDFEPIRVRIMQEAYELADRNDSESYNAIKVMCGDVQRMLPPKRTWVGLTDEERKEIMHYEKDFWGVSGWEWKCMEAIEAKLKEKNFD